MIKKLPESRENILGFEINEKISLEEEKRLLSYFEEILETHEKVSVLIILGEEAGWGIKAGIEDLRWGVKHIKNIDKVAIVSDKKVWKWAADTGKIFKIEEKYFTLEEIEKAWEWVGATF